MVVAFAALAVAVEAAASARDVVEVTTAEREPEVVAVTMALVETCEAVTEPVVPTAEELPFMQLHAK